MNFVTDYEINVANRRIEDMRLEIANNRIRSAMASHEGSPRGFKPVAFPIALFDSAMTRASQGSVRRHSARSGRQTPA